MATNMLGFRTQTEEGKPYPRRTQEMLARQFDVYKSFGAEKAFPHVLRVLDSAERHNMLEFDKVEDPRGSDDPKDLNHKLATLVAIHPFKRSKANKKTFPSEDFERSELVVEGFNVFDALRENDLGAQDGKAYGRLLEKPTLGLLARMVDLTQYGKDGLASEEEFSGLDPSVFYVFDKVKSRSEYELVGMAAKNVYSPLADLFGYRNLAGDLYEIYYYHVDRSMHEKVMLSLDMLRTHIELTNLLKDAAICMLRKELDEAGYKYGLKVRGSKHPGKVMEKADRYSRHTWQSVQDVVSELHDLAAFTVILHSRNGKLISQNDVAEFERVARMIVRITSSLAPLRRGLKDDSIYTDMVRHPKTNGYQSYHVDMVFEDHSLVGMEAIVRNGRMDEYAERGGAAHFLYKGGTGLAMQIANTYRHVIRGIESPRSILLGPQDTGPQRRILVHVQGESRPRMRIVPEKACVGEALICADVDLSNGLVLRPNISLLSPISGVDSLHLEHSPRKGEMLSRSVIDMLLHRAVYEHTVEKLRQYRKLATY
jgi:ppGpp synthetase/RelA/SpoT-type nucleotidyltranferase